MNKLAVRRLWFQVHKWIGLLLAVLIVPITLSGAALVWSDGLDRLINPARYAITGETLLPLARYFAAGHAVAQGDSRVANLVLPAGEGPVAVTLTSPQAAGEPRANRTMVYLDPPTGRVLDVADNRHGLMRTLHVLHGNLLVPGVGRQIVGLVGVALMLASFTGLWLWWPVVGAWARGLRWRRHPHVDANLHSMLGFWIALPLFVLSLTGAWISFPVFFGSLVGEGRPAYPLAIAARPMEHPALAIDDVVARAAPLAPAAALRTVILPTERQADWTLAYDSQPMITVAVADDSGVAARGASFSGGRSSVGQLMRRLHDGTGMGLAWQVLIFAGGVLPAVLAATGLLMWWRARGWRRAVADKRRGHRIAHPNPAV